MNKKILLFAILICFEVFVLCRRGKCPPEKLLVYCSLSSNSANFDTLRFRDRKKISVLDSLPIENLGIRLNFNMAVEFCWNKLNLGFIPKLMATEPCFTFTGPREGILKIDIFDDLGITDTSNSNDTLNSFFRLGYIETIGTLSLDSSNMLKMFSFSRNDDNDLERPLLFLLNIKAMNPKWHKFKFQVNLSDGRTLEHTTDSIYLY